MYHGDAQVSNEDDRLLQERDNLEVEIERLNGLLAEEARVAGHLSHLDGLSGFTFFWNTQEERWQGVDERDNAPN